MLTTSGLATLSVEVTDAAKTDRAVLVGSSLGGRTAIDLVPGHPARVAGLLLIAPAVRGAPYPDPIDDEAALDALPKRQPRRADLTMQINSKLNGPTSPEGRVSGEPRLAGSTTPTAVLCGDLDTSGLRAIGQELAARLPNGTFSEFSGVAHLPQLEAPTELADAMRDFLQTLA